MSGLGEFELIRRYFSSAPKRALLGVGDDCALLPALPAGEALAVSTDTLNQGVHFLPGTSPADLGYRALAVNLSDLAACGARPLAFTLSLTLEPEQACDAWLAPFAQALLQLAQQVDIELIGGNTTRGALAIGITVLGSVPVNLALRRDGARVGDDVWVSGTLGDARLGLASLRRELTAWPGLEAAEPALRQTLLARLHCPTPRLALGLALRGVAHSAIDVSDGFAADLGHVLEQSGVAAEIEPTLLPASTALRQVCQHNQPSQTATEATAPRETERRMWQLQLEGGDDYELVFTAAPAAREAVLAAAQSCHTPVQRVGCIVAKASTRLSGNDTTRLWLRLPNGSCQPWSTQGFEHFQASQLAG